jgi:hypothetical protein
MSVYVGIDVHRNRSQVAVVARDGKVQLNRNVVNGSEPMLRLIGRCRPGRRWHSKRPMGRGADRAAGGLRVRSAHGAPLRCTAIASARLKNDKAGAAILAQLLRADLLPGAWIAPLEVRRRWLDVTIGSKIKRHSRLLASRWIRHPSDYQGPPCVPVSDTPLRPGTSR